MTRLEKIIYFLSKYLRDYTGYYVNAIEYLRDMEYDEINVNDNFINSFIKNYNVEYCTANYGGAINLDLAFYVKHSKNCDIVMVSLFGGLGCNPLQDCFVIKVDSFDTVLNYENVNRFETIEIDGKDYNLYANAFGNGIECMDENGNIFPVFGDELDDIADSIRNR